MDNEPIPAVSDGGRNLTTGRFTTGNQCSRGNAATRKAAAFRAKMFRCVSPGDFGEIVRKLVDEAKTGKPWAIKLALEYLVGRSEGFELNERLLILETTLVEGR
jgi:hypothetical protein